MKTTACILFVIFCSSLSYGQGIKFEELDWEENLKAAKKADKLVYIDFYTTWCAPCTFIAKKYFTDKEAGQFYNKNFYCLKLDAEKEGETLAKKYHVNGYPTNVFINPSNEAIVFKTVGAPSSLSGFIANGTIAVEEFKDTMSLETYAKKMEEGDSSKAFTLKYLKKLTRLDKPNTWPLDVYSHLYFKKDIDSVEVKFINQYLKDINGGTFTIFKNNKAAFDLYAEQSGHSYKWDDVLSSKLYATNTTATNNRDQRLHQKCIRTTNELIPERDRMSMTYYLTKSYYEGYDSIRYQENEYDYADKLLAVDEEFFKEKDAELWQSIEKQIEWQSKEWSAEQLAKLDEVKEKYRKDKQYSQTMTMRATNHLNGQAWHIFEGNDRERFEKALTWAKKAYEMAKKLEHYEAESADTYANLLFALGKKTQAIAIEKEAIEKARAAGADASGYEKTLNTFGYIAD